MLMLLLALMLVFLFNGTPDLWDRMHGSAMAYFEEKDCAKEVVGSKK